MNIRHRTQKKELAALRKRSGELLVAERHEKNLELLEKAIDRFPDDSEIRLLYATTLLKFRPSDVARQATTAIELSPDDPAILIRAASLLLNRGEVEAARSAVIRANDLTQPDFALFAGLVNLNGLLAALDGNDELAEEKLRSAVELEPTSPRFARFLTVFLAERGRLEEAVAVLDEALKHVEDKDYLQDMRTKMTQEITRSE